MSQSANLKADCLYVVALSVRLQARAVYRLTNKVITLDIQTQLLSTVRCIKPKSRSQIGNKDIMIMGWSCL
jgi:hypothetical protein